MADLISRKTVIDLFETYQPHMAISVIEFGNALNGLPTVEAEPVRHGRWIGISDGYADGYPVYDEWECSVCGTVFEDEKPDYKYCPFCGAKMDAQEEEE